MIVAFAVLPLAQSFKPHCLPSWLAAGGGKVSVGLSRDAEIHGPGAAVTGLATTRRRGLWVTMIAGSLSGVTGR